MSHFYTWVITNEGEEIGELMKPYDESLEVEEYEKECYCIGRKAKSYAREKVEKIKSIDVYRKEYEGKKRKSDYWWDVHIKPYTDLINKFAKEHEEYGKPEKECEGCGGTGKYKTTYNQKSKWDWYEQGGRWTGEIKGDEIMVKKLLELKRWKTPFAIVNSDQWYEKGEMGWWGMVSNRKEEIKWRKEVKRILNKNLKSKITIVDCHI